MTHDPSILSCLTPTSPRAVNGCFGCCTTDVAHRLWGRHRPAYHGANASPAGPVIYVANHNSHLDGMSLMTIVPSHRIHLTHSVAAQDFLAIQGFEGGR